MIIRRRRLIATAALIVVGFGVFLAVDIYLSAGPSLDCGSPSTGPLGSGIEARRVTSGGARRCYLIFTPASIEPGRAAPVVVGLHGFAGNARGFRPLSVWEPVAERESFRVVYPEGSAFPLRWNISPAANIPAVDDVRFVEDVLADLSRQGVLDPQRIYVTGFSNGGGMVHRIACRLSSEVAAVGIVDAIDPGMLDPC